MTGVIEGATPEQRQALQHLRSFEWVGYIDSVLRNAGFREHDLHEMVQDVVTKLLVQPGNLFKGWKGQPLDRRFKASVRHAVLNIVEKHGNRRRLLPTIRLDTDFTPDDLRPSHFPARQIMTDVLIDEFREYLRERLGPFAVTVLNWRLEKRGTKELVGQAQFRSPSSYHVKKTVQAVKAAGRQFAEGAPNFQAMVEKAMGEEKGVRRQQRTQQPDA